MHIWGEARVRGWLVPLRRGRRVRVARWAIRLSGWGSAIVAIAIAGLVAVNAFDEPLAPEARLLSASSYQVAADPGNGYVWMLGLLAPEPEDAYACGARALGRLQELDARSESLSKDDPLLADHLVLAGRSRMRCQPEKGSCIELAAQKYAEIKRELAQSGTLLDRAQRMRAQSVFADAYTPSSWSSPVPPYHNVVVAQFATLLQASVAVSEGRIEDAIALAEEDMRFSRRVLAGSTNLIGKMVANTLVARDVLFLSDLLSKRPEQMRRYRKRVASALEPLSQGEIALDAALRTEARGLVRLLLLDVPRTQSFWSAPDAPTTSAARIADRFASLFYQPNATANRALRRLQTEMAVTQVPAVKFDEVCMETDALTQKYRDFAILDYVLNPIGNALLGSDRRGYAKYAAHMHDLQALIKLVDAQAAMLPLTSAAERTAFLSSDVGRLFTDPYTRRQLSVDAGTGQPFFLPRSDRSWVGELKKQFGGVIRVGP